MRLLPLILVGLVPACGGDDGGTPDAHGALELSGGSYAVPGCGFDVVTREGAEAPAPGADVLGDTPAPRQLRLGFAGDPKTSIAVVWRTDTGTTSSVIRYGTGGALDQTGAGVTYQYIEGVGGIGDTIRLHEAHLCGLQPDTVYSYQVGGVGADGTESFSPTYTFRTAPDVTADPSASVSIAFVGDSRGGYDIWAEDMAQIATRAPDLIVYTGDVVTLGQVQAEWDQFFDAAPDLFASVPMVATHGNHEVNSIEYYTAFALPGDEENFSFDYGHAHLTLLNTDPANTADLTGKEQTFLDSDLAAATTTWKIVGFHRGIYSSGTMHGSDTDLRAAWGPVIDAHTVDVVVQGHDHLFERSKPLRNDVIGATPADGTIYLVSGGAGAALYSLEDPAPAWQEVGMSRYNATVMQIGPTMLQSDTFAEDGSALDSFQITK